MATKPATTDEHMQLEDPVNTSFKDKLLLNTLLPTVQYTNSLPTKELDLRDETTPLQSLDNFIPITKVDKNRLYSPWKYSVMVKLVGRRVGHQLLKEKLNNLWRPSEEIPLIDLVSYQFKSGNLNSMHHKHVLLILTWIRMPELPKEFYDLDILLKVRKQNWHPPENRPHNPIYITGLGHTSSKCTHNPVNLSDHADSPKGKDSTEGWKQVQFPARLTQKLPTRTRAGNHLHESQLPKGKFLTMDTANEHKTTKQERSGKSSDLKKSIESETATSNYYRRTQVALPSCGMQTFSTLLTLLLLHKKFTALSRKDPVTKILHGQELLDITTTPPKDVVEDQNLNYISRRISVHEGDKMELIEKYLAEVRNKLLKTVAESSDTSMKSLSSHEAEDIQESQSLPPEKILDDKEIAQAEAFLYKSKGKDKM
ncbi:hypothetical protein FXO38_20094 [Capsicum annuum]|nr:hypothetical protein FXO38_20094 [Capsicum annuum]